MKKIALIGLICLSVMGTAHADEEFMDVDIEMDGTFSAPTDTCVSHTFDYQENQTASNDEFLHVDWDGGVGFECDNKHCPDGYMVTLFPGHTWKGERIMEKRTYKCSLGFNDKWEIVTDSSIESKRHGFRYCGNGTTLADKQFPVEVDSYFFSSNGDADMIYFLLDKSGEHDVSKYKYVTALSAKCSFVDGDGWTNIKIDWCDDTRGYLLCNGKCVHYYKDLVPKFTEAQLDAFDEEFKASKNYSDFISKGVVDESLELEFTRMIPRLLEYGGCREANIPRIFSF